MNKKTAADGIRKCVQNAERLIEAAQCLFEKDNNLGTVFIVTAIEEYAKTFLIMQFIIGNLTQKEFDKAFRSHDMKRNAARMFALISTEHIDGSKEAQKFLRMINKVNFKITRDLALYVEYESKKFNSPQFNFPDFAMVFQIALRLKRVLGCLNSLEGCLELLDRDITSKKSSSRLRITKKYIQNIRGL